MPLSLRSISILLATFAALLAPVMGCCCEAPASTAVPAVTLAAAPPCHRAPSTTPSPDRAPQSPAPQGPCDHPGCPSSCAVPTLDSAPETVRTHVSASPLPLPAFDLPLMDGVLASSVAVPLALPDRWAEPPPDVSPQQGLFARHTLLLI